MKLKITIIIFLFSYWLTPVFACSCASYEDKGFCDFVDYAEFVVDATVTERMDREGQLRIRINEVFKGVEAISNEIVLHNTMSSTWLSEELGDHFILGINKFEYDSGSEIFVLPLCGVYHLQVDGNRVKGDISKNKKSMSYNAFRSFIQTQNCPASSPTFSVFIENQSLQLTTIYEQTDKDIPIRLYNMNGQIVSAFSVEMNGRISEQKQFGKALSSGIYVVYIDLGGVNVQVKKVLIR